MATEFAEDLVGGSQPKSAVLLIVGEAFTDSDKQSILEEIVKGFKGWDSEASGVDINDELAQVANRADLGEEGPDGERIIRHCSENAIIELLINPQSQTVKQSLKTLLTVLSATKVVIYAGYAFQGTAAWVVQDDLFSFGTFNQVFKDSNVENALKQIDGPTLMVHTTSPSDWTSAFKGSDAERLVKVSVNPKPKLENLHGVVQFTAYVGNLVRSVPLGSMLQASDVIGSISFTRPVIYIFPGHHGDAALFGMKDFNMLINGGYSRHSCFWDFVRHLEGIDALLMTHLGPDNLFGIKALLERKAIDTIHPGIDYMYMNTGKTLNGTKDSEQTDNKSELLINLSVEGSRLLELSRKLGHAPQPLTRHLSGNLEPVNLFHKVGKGSLDMYVLNPVGDAKEMKDFLGQWGKQAASFSQVNGIPIPNCTSICALLVVRPASPTENVTRILFPGTAPQHKLLEGLERVKHLEFLKHSTFCTQDLQKPKKPASASGARTAPAAPRPASARSTASKAEPPKRLETKTAAPKPSAPLASSRSSKLQKDSTNKRATSATKEKVKLDEKEKETKSKSSTSSSPSKASGKSASPVKTPSSPAKSPAATSPSKPPASSPAVVDQPLIPEPASSEQPHQPSPEANHLDEGLTSTSQTQQAPTVPDLMGDDIQQLQSPEPLAQPAQSESCVDPGLRQQQEPSPAATQQTLQEMGVYDDDEGVDNGFDDKENGPQNSDLLDDVQPQSLPEPALEIPSGPEPDLIQDTFPQPSAMERSQIFEHEIEPDYSAEPQSEEPEKDSKHEGVEKQSSPVGDDIKESSPSFPNSPEKEKSPVLEEPSFVDDASGSQSSNTISQSIQYGVVNDNGFQMGGIREEEEEEAAAERDDFEQSNQADINRQRMEEMGIYDDDEGQDDGAEAAESGDYAYENENFDEEEIRLADTTGGNIPEAFERDESPTPVEKPVAAEAEADSGQEDTDSIDGGTPDHDKDIDEAFGTQHPDQVQKQDSLEDVMAGQESGTGDGQQCNPFIGLGAQNSAADSLDGKTAAGFEQDDLESNPRGDSAQFDPLAQWGPPTGLPAPSPLVNEACANQEEMGGFQQDEQQENLVDSQEVNGYTDDGDQSKQFEDRAFHGFHMPTVDDQLADAADIPTSDKGSEADPSEFDPLAAWGQPMGLPSPPPVETNSKAAATKVGAGDAKKTETKKPASSPTKAKSGIEKRPASAAKSPTKPANGTTEPPKSARAKPDPKRASLDTSRTARPASGKSLDTSRVETKSRPSTATRKPASASKARASPDVVKMPPLPPFTPFYVDLTYIPNHGDISYVDGEFFKRVRAKNYVLSASNPNPKVLEMLIEAKATWDKGNEQEVTVIPTYETPILQHWLAVHKEKLAESKIVITPAASRCTVRLQDHEDSCYTYRLEF